MLHGGCSAIGSGDLDGGNFVVFDSGVVKVDVAEDFGFIGVVGGDRAYELWEGVIFFFFFPLGRGVG